MNETEKSKEKKIATQQKIYKKVKKECLKTIVCTRKALNPKKKSVHRNFVTLSCKK